MGTEIDDPIAIHGCRDKEIVITDQRVLTGGSLITNGRVTQNFQKEKMRSNNSNNGNYLLLWGILSKLMSSNML
jgi:hypothetical protein